MTRVAAPACIALCLLGISSALAQGYPSKPIRLIAPYPPGGGIDASARIIGQALTEQLGQQVIVENRAGATGRIGTEFVAKAPADGYTLLLGSGAPNAVIPSVTPNLPYDAINDFAPISLVGTTDYTLVVHPSLPARSVKELIALAKANPEKLTYGSSGTLSNTHLAGELLKQLANVNIIHVAYKGTGPALVSVLTGETAVSFGGGPAAAPHVNAKRLRALATTGSKRRASGLPTISETLPGYDVNQWYGVLAPAGTPRAVLERLHKEIVRAIANPKIAQLFTNLDTDATSNTQEEFSALIRSEIEKWRKVIKAAAIPLT
ncbi:MAG: tripartite tricarboxylate transporter substrate binding protein [Betaproteobacteria bacterium]|nr:tripartite tricarboxylate transporter substrate binding protein [Betaproteobacteria bacterium]